MKVSYGSPNDLDAWMALVESVAWNFPGLETPEALEDHRRTVRRFMEKRQALCARNDDAICGVLLFSRRLNMICCLAVSPDFRRQGVATALMHEALAQLDFSRPVTVTTFREGDPWGIAPRPLYRKFGFVEGELLTEFNYPVQQFVRPPVV